MKYIILLLFLSLHFQNCFSEHFRFYGITRECEKNSDLNGAFVYGKSLYIDNDNRIHFWNWEGDDKKVCGSDIKKEYCLYTDNKIMINELINKYTICDNRNYNKHYKYENKCNYSMFDLICLI